MVMSEYDKTHVSDLINGYGDWFTAQLFRLICKADTDNRDLLALGFPEEVEVVRQFLGRD